MRNIQLKRIYLDYGEVDGCWIEVREKYSALDYHKAILERPDIDWDKKVHDEDYLKIDPKKLTKEDNQLIDEYNNMIANYFINHVLLDWDLTDIKGEPLPCNHMGWMDIPTDEQTHIVVKWKEGFYLTPPLEESLEN